MATSDVNRYLFHSRLVSLIVAQYAEERHRIPQDDPDRENKVGAIKEACARDLKHLYRYFFGRKAALACRNCPMLDDAMQREAEKVDDPQSATLDWGIPGQE